MNKSKLYIWRHVKSHLTFGSEVWCPSSSHLFRTIEGVKMRAIFWILMKKHEEAT